MGSDWGEITGIRFKPMLVCSGGGQDLSVTLFADDTAMYSEVRSRWRRAGATLKRENKCESVEVK